MSMELSNIDIALYALYKLGGDKKPIHTEDVALQCWKLVPERFSWKKHPEYPEIDPARFALEDAAKPKYGALARLVVRKIAEKSQAHWMLRAAGVEYVRARLKQLLALEAGEVEAVSQRTEKDRFVASLERHSAFKKFVSSGTCDTVEPFEFTDMLRCSLDASPNVLRDRLESLKARVAGGGDAKVIDFLTACESRFHDMLEGT